MLTYLQLKNFRRHVDTEIYFSPEDQLVLIEGMNGTGKTTLIEAVQYLLTGEGRNGKRNLDQLVKRGSELEGMEAVCEFTISDTNYRVERKRVEGISSARLTANGVALVEGPTAVDHELARVLGMDAAGFKLAVLAKQKELDGLTSLNKRERKEMLARLLRVEAIGKAAGKAHSQYSRAAEILSAMGSPPAIEELEATATNTAATAAATAASRAASQEALDTLHRRLGETSSVEADYRTALEAQARAQGALDSEITERDRLASLLERHVVPEPKYAASRPLDDILNELRQVDVSIAQAETSARAHTERASLQVDYDALLAEQTRLTAELGDGPEKTALALTAAESRLTALVEEGTAAREAARTAAADAVREQTRLDELARRGANLASLDAVCDRCGQTIDEDHRTRQAAELEAEKEACQVALVGATDAATSAETRVTDLRAAHDTLSRDIRVLAQAHTQAETANSALVELSRRRASYELRLEAKLPAVVDIDSLYTAKGVLAAEVASARQAAVEADEIAKAAGRKAELLSALDTVSTRVAERQIAQSQAAPDNSLTEAYAARLALVSARDAEAELTASLTAQYAEGAARAEAALQRLEEAKSFHTSYTERAARARIASHAKAVLKDVHDRLSQQLRPSLEGAVSDLLGRLSEGRFTSVRVSDDYDITVLDDGEFRPLSELSGGEVDLVALAVRLALSSVVADRHGSDAVGLLILDECFGSQDPLRRESILAALRQLRSSYGQIFLISHVGGLADAADKVIEVRTDQNRENTEIIID